MAGKGGGGRNDDDIRVALKLPKRGSLHNREVAKASQALRKVLGTSGGKGRGGGKSRAGAGFGTGGRRGAAPSAGGASARPAAAHQRVSVRWTYAKNRSDGQWSAHGRYLERESAQEPALEKDLDAGVDKESGAQLDRASGLDGREINEPGSGRLREHDERYDAARSTGPGSTPLRESDVAEIAVGQAPQTLNGLRRLSSIPLVRDAGRLAKLLSRNAPADVEQGRAAGAAGLRRGEAGPGRADGKTPGGRGAKGGKRAVEPFGSDGVTGSISDTLKAWQSAGDEHLFKLIVSPEFGERMNLREHVRGLMGKMEKDLGTRLQWVAIDHYNTDNPHVHIAVRGIDERGQKLEVDPAYIKEGSRRRAEEIATRELGFRTDRDVAEAFDRQIAQQRFTDLDRMLMRKAQNQHVQFETAIPKSGPARETRLRLIHRLSELSKMGLAERVGSHTWKLDVNLEPALRARQIAEDRLKTKFLHRETISDPRAQMVTTDLRTLGQRVAGKLVGTGQNEKNGRAYMMIEGFDGLIHFVNQTPKVEKMRGSGDLRVGDYLSLEVTARRDNDGRTTGTFTRVYRYGPDLTTELLDKEMMASSKTVERPVRTQTVAENFRAAVADRQAKLIQAGAITVRENRLVPSSREAHDKVRFADAGITAPDFKYSAPLLATVVARGQKSAVVETLSGKRYVMSAERLASMGLDFKYVTPGGTMFVGQDHKQTTVALGVKAERLAAITNEPKINRLDTIARQLTDVPDTHPLAPILAQRIQVWRERGIAVQSGEFVRDAAMWTRNHELAASAELKSMIDAPRLNKLDYLMQQPFAPASAPLAKAIDERALVWLERGVDPRDSRFSMLASVWRKGEELREAIEQKGVEPVLEELGRQKGKSTQTLACEPGKQISGRVLAIAKETDHTAVVVDTGGELTLVKQPLSHAVDVRVGQRIRAQAQEVDGNRNRQLAMWRFADLEREQAIQKGKEKGQGKGAGRGLF